MDEKEAKWRQICWEAILQAALWPGGDLRDCVENEGNWVEKNRLVI